MISFDLNNQVADRGLSRRDWQEIARAFFKASALKGKYYFSLALVDDKGIKKINRLYRGRNRPTDVLSFAEDWRQPDFFGQPGHYLGEVVISVPTAKKQARLAGHSYRREAAALLIHGLAHLLGHDHENVSRQQEQAMKKLEQRAGDLCFKR